MTVNVKSEQEVLIARAVEAGVLGAGRMEAADEVFAIGIELVKQRLEAKERLVGVTTAEAWSRDFHEWVHSHSLDTPLLSDEAIGRESIYGYRGE